MAFLNIFGADFFNIQDKDTPNVPTTSSSSGSFPYRFDDGTPALVSRMPSDQLAEDQIERANRTCERCDSKVDNQRAHMGAHILRKLRGVEEAVKTPITGDFPCGFCGETGRSECAVFVKVTSKSTSIETNCRLKGPIKYAYAERGSATTPCRNVPLVCILCPSQLTAGKATHLAAAHPEYASPHNPDGAKRLPITVLESFELQRVEQLALGIPANKIPPKFIKVAGPDEGADLQPQQLGVRYKAPVRTTRIATIPVAGPSSRTAAAPVAGPSSRPKKKRKGNGGESLPP
ncbi:hypothetical protein DFH09DRAFT_1332133 [Mycena vulgaris]|nr:hypothetical protein DFH09DRAFT_1332133 [Mycena vulgaris]